MDLNATMCCFNCENIPAGLFLLLWWSSAGTRAEKAELRSEAAPCWHSCLSRPINKRWILGAVWTRDQQTCSPVGRVCVNMLKTASAFSLSIHVWDDCQITLHLLSPLVSPVFYPPSPTLRQQRRAPLRVTYLLSARGRRASATGRKCVLT